MNRKIALPGKRARLVIGRALLGTLALSILVITAPNDAHAFDTSVIDWAINELCGHITGSFGALLTSVAVLGAIVSAALGSFRVFFGAIIVGVGSYGVPNIMTMYFPEAAAECTAEEGGRAAAKSAVALQSTVPNKSAAAASSRNAKSLDSLAESFNATNIPSSVSSAPAPSTSSNDSVVKYENDEEESARSWGVLADANK